MAVFTSGHEAAEFASAEAERINGEYSDDLAQAVQAAVKPIEGAVDSYSVSSHQIAAIVKEWNRG